MTKVTLTTEQQETLDGLKKLVALCEKQPILIPSSLTMSRWPDAEEVEPLLKALGSFKKHDFGTLIEVKKDLGGYVTIEINISKRDTCESEVVGTEVRKTRKLKTEAVYEEVEEEVPIIKWKCGSLLAGPKSQELVEG